MRVLAYTSPSRGDLFPVVPVLRELSRRGHEVHVRTLAGAVPVLQDLGLHAEAVDPRIGLVPTDDYSAGNPRAAIQRSLRMFGTRAPYEADDLRAATARHEPDLVLVDFNAWGSGC